MRQRRFRSFRDVLSTVPDGKARHELRNFNFMNSGQPPSVGALLKELGFAVDFRDLPKSTSGFLEPSIYSRTGFQIVVNKNHPTTRQRFTALHELAHYFLHPRYREAVQDPVMRASIDGLDHFYASDIELTEEREANEWVDALVFEQRALQAALSRHGSDRKTIARKFGVSEKALDIAIRKRGLK